ncbi:MAG: peptidylprolyl isomerase [Ferruginibacter sp.]
MKFQLKFLFFIAFAFGSAKLSAQSKKVVADKIVAIVGNKIVLQSDIENNLMDMARQGVEVPENARCLTLEQSMGVKALVLQAEKDSIPVTDEEVEADIELQIRQFISAYGSKDELEKVAGRSVYQLREDFKEGFRDRKLAAAMRNKIVQDIKITPNEVKSFFEKIPADSLPLYESEIEIGQILRYPKASREAEEYAIQQLNEFKKQIESGSRDFKTVATLYSEDPGSKERGGMYEINRNQKEMDPTWMAKAFTLKEGQVSNPFKTKFGYHIIMLENRAGDDAVVRHILKVPQVTQVELQEGFVKLDSVRSGLIAGTMDFGSAVHKYSDDEASKFTAGMIQGRDGTFLTIDQVDKDMVPVLQNLKPGEYSQPVAYTDERGRKGVRIVYLKSKSEPHRENLSDDYSKIAQRALENKKEVAIEKWFYQHINTYYIMVADEYKNCDGMQKWMQVTNSTGKK